MSETTHAANTQTFYEEGPRTGQTPEGSTKVGWTTRDSRGKVVDGFAFLINPQGIGRALGSRAQIQAVKSGFYVDDFGPAPTAITVRQLVASGKEWDGGFYTAREDVQRFLKRIYLPATRGPNRSRLRVYFHDHHFERGFEERVFFPPQSTVIERSVEQHGIWRLDLQMISLEQFPYAEIEVQRSADVRTYTVKVGDTLDKIARAVAGSRASSAQVKKVKDRIIALNEFIKRKRTVPGGAVGKPMRVYKGETIRLPG